MYFKKISIKNFLSYGERPVEFIFDRHNMTLITAKNGRGKSGIIDAITYLFFGKSFRDIKQDLLINSTNKKNMFIEGELVGINGKNVIIRRGAKPGIFEIYEDGVLVKQNAKSKDYQEYLETYILGMNFVTFSQTVIISKTRYTPFMKLKAGERRSFVESILNIEIFGDMQKLQSKKISSLKDEEIELKTNIKISENNLSSKIDSLKRYLALIEKTKKESSEVNETEINNITLENSKLSEENIRISGRLSNIDYSSDLSKYEKLKSKFNEISYDNDSIKKDILKMQNKSDTCHVCGSPMDISHLEDHIKNLNSKLESNKILLERISVKTNELSKIEVKSKEQDELNRTIQYEISSNKRLISANESRIKDLKLKTYDTSKYDEDVKLLKQEGLSIKRHIKESMENLQKLIVDIDHNNFVYSILKDSGIKSSIIQNSIHTINHIINDYLHKFGFYINFELDSEFNETIHFKGIDNLTYNNFSEGEKLRVDLALILAWRQISLLQSGISSNLLFFDEIVDASMDAEGVELFAQSLVALKDTNIWMISHTPEKIENYVRGYIHLDKIDGFTTITHNK